MTSVANLIDHGILEEDDENFFVPSRDWKVEIGVYRVYHVERTDEGSPTDIRYVITREGKYEGHLAYYTVQPNEDVEFELYKKIDPEF